MKLSWLGVDHEMQIGWKKMSQEDDGYWKQWQKAGFCDHVDGHLGFVTTESFLNAFLLCYMCPKRDLYFK